MANVHVNLLFEANTQNAINNINQLGQLLNQISSKAVIGVDSGSLNQAAQAARELQVHLGNAVNVNTGRLDLTKLNTSLKQSNQSLAQLSKQLVSTGTIGQQAFVKLANSVASAQLATFKLGGALSSALKIMGSAMMWSAAYGAVDALTGAIKGAIDYTKDLNKALVDISIVSNLSADGLEKFAKSAARSAKDLKTTTVEYAEAALIFYQQGLDTDKVKQRTDAVIKMMHVTGQTAQTVSDQMTAVWNNFDDGTRSLEYYIDVLTALGAATASSTDEITQGLEKFAAVANTVGLSYEYAATALATVTAQTRQSADVVGTAFKTLFARIQDLELGETLEDGVTLGSYSQALAKIGVSALDANGNLREMDDILNDMGAKWDTLTEAQQAATAQSVAGVRQYTQLIALMDNWDTFKLNLEVAEDAEGTLDEQFQKWDNGIEAAEKRLQQTKNEVYSSIMNEDTIITFTNMFSTLIQYVGDFIEGLGGIGPLILVVIGLFSSKLIPLATSFVTSIGAGFSQMFGIGQSKMEMARAEFLKFSQSLIESKVMSADMNKQLDLANNLITIKARMEKEIAAAQGQQKDLLQNQLTLYESLNLEAQEAIQNHIKAQENVKNAMNNVRSSGNYTEMRKKADAYIAEREGNHAAKKNIDDLRAKAGDMNSMVLGRTQNALYDPGITQTTEVQSLVSEMQKASSLKPLRIIEKDGEAQMEASINNLKLLVEEKIKYKNISEQAVAVEKDLQAVLDQGTQISLTKGKTADYAAALDKKDEASTQVKEAQGKWTEAKAALAVDPKNATLITAEADARKNLKAALNEQADAEKQVQATSKLLSTSEKQGVATTRQSIQTYKELAQAAGLTKDKINATIDSIKNSSAPVEALKTAFADLGTSSKIMGNNLESLQSQAIVTLRESLDPAQLQQLITVLDQAGGSAARVAAALRGQAQAAELVAVTMPRMGQIVQQSVTAFASLSSSIAMSYNSIKSFLNTLNDENASGLDKIMAGLMTIGMVLPMVNMLFGQNSAIVKMSTMITERHAAALLKKAGVTQIEATSTATATAAQMGFNTALYMCPLFWIVAAIMAVIAAAIILISVLSKAGDNTVDFSAALESTSQALEEATAANEKFISTFKGYEEARKEIDTLTAGTLAYTEAVDKANEKANELIDTYALVEGLDYDVDQFGLITIHDDVLNEIKARHEQSVAQMQFNQVVVTRNMAENQMDGNLSRLYKNYSIDSGETLAILQAYANGDLALDDSTVEYDGRTIAKSATTAITTAFQEWSESHGFGNSQLEANAALEALQGELEKTAEQSNKYNLQLISLALASGDAAKRLNELAGTDEEKNDLEKAVAVLVSAGEEDGKIKPVMTSESEGPLRGAETDDKFFELSQNAQYSDSDQTLFSFLKETYGLKVGENGEFDHNHNAANFNTLLQNYVAEAQGIDPSQVQVTWDEENKKYVAYNSATGTKIGDYDEKSGTALVSNWALGKYESDYLAGKSEAALKNMETAYGKIDKNGSTTVDNTEAVQQMFAAAVGDKGQFNISSIIGELTPEEREQILRNPGKALSYLGLDGVWNEKAFGSIWGSEAEMRDSLVNAIQNQWTHEGYASGANAIGVSKAETLGLDPEDYKEYRDALAAANEELANNPKLLNDVALANMRLNRGLESVASNWDEWQKGLAAGEGSYDALMATEGLRDALGDMLNIDTSELDSSFITSTETMNLMEAAAEGDADALERLRELTAQRIAVDAGVDLSKTTEDGQSLLDIINSINDEDLEIGATIDDSSFMATLYKMLAAQNTTVEDMQKMFDALGWSPEMTTQAIEIKQEHIEQGYVTDINGNRHKVTSSMVAGSTVEFPVFKSIKQGLPSMTYRGKAKNAVSKKKDKEGSGREKKKYEDEIERYHEINAELEDLERQLDAIAEAKDRAFGPDKLAYMDQEIAKQRELAEAQKRYLSEIEANLKSDASYMLGYGAILDEEGRIANYDELMQSKIDAYNSGKMSEEAYEQFVKDLEQYEETLGLLKDEQQEFINLQNTIIDLGLEKVQYEVEFKVSIEEDSLALVEFMMDNLTDSVADAADTIGYFGQQADSAFKNMDTYAKAVRDVFSVEDVNGEAQFSEEQINALLSNNPEAIAAALEGETLTEAQIEALREYRDAMIDEYKNAQEASIGIIETLGSAFEDAQKPFADAAAEMEHLTSMTQAYVDVIELVGAEHLGVDKKLLTAAAKTQTALAQQQLTNSKNQLEQSKQMLADYRVAYEQALASGDAKVIEAAKEQLESMEATVKENEQAMLSDLSAALEAAATEFGKAMEEIASSFEDAMTGAYGSFAALEASFEQQKALADRYLDDYQKIYELSKLNRDIVNSIDDNDSIRAKERLRDIQEEINKLQESNVEMTQYEVDELRAKYELRLAEIALEEAQNAKSQVRMARDSEGNWSYVYTADEEAVGTAEQNYEDKLYAYQELAQNRTDELLEQMISIPREFSEAVQEIYQDQTLNDEERRLRIKETEEYYQEMYSFVVQQLRVVNADAAELYTLDWKRYSEMTGYKISLDSNWIDSFEETVVAQLTGYSTLAEAEQGFLTSSQGMLTSLSGAYQTYQTTTKATLDSALGDLAGFLGDESTEGSLAYYLAQAKEKAKEVTNSAAAIGAAHAGAFENAVKAAKEQLGNYQTQMANWKKENELLIESINKVISTYANTKSAQDGINGIGNALKGLEGAARAVESAANAAAQALQNMYNTSPNTGNAPKNITIFDQGSDPATNSFKGQQTVTVSNIKGYVPSGAAAVKGKSLITLVMNSGKTYTVWTNTSNLQYLSVTTLPNQTPSGGGGGYTPYDPENNVTFDTGGYTGSWDSSGRLAMLHQKELVLNAEDTVNFLDAVNIVREIAQAIDLGAVAQAMQMGNLQAAQATSTAQTLEQQVSIHAEFPNATNHSEIEEAFRNLTLTASQFANRKN